MNVIFRWILILAGTFILGVVLILSYLSIMEYINDPMFQLSLYGLIFIGLWIGSGIYLKKQESDQIKQPFAYGFITALFMICALMYSIDYFFPSQQKLQKMATQAEDEYFLLTAASIDHDRICNAAIKAYKYNFKLKNEERITMFKYALMRDKCL